MTLVSDLITTIETELSQVPGLGTQLYSDARVQQLITTCFKLYSQEAWWPEMMQWSYPVLDGVTGNVTGLPFANYGDIRAVFPPTNVGYRGRPLPELSRDLNPQLILGNVPKFIEGKAISINPNTKLSNNDPLQIYPITSTGTLAIHGRVMPALPFKVTDDVSLDDLLITWAACWMYMVDDGSNPASIQKFEMLADKRLLQLKDTYNNKPIDLDPRIHRTVDTWAELP